jgi:hypothetical protein
MMQATGHAIEYRDYHEPPDFDDLAVATTIPEAYIPQAPSLRP